MMADHAPKEKAPRTTRGVDEVRHGPPTRQLPAKTQEARRARPPPGFFIPPEFPQLGCCSHRRCLQLACAVTPSFDKLFNERPVERKGAGHGDEGEKTPLDGSRLKAEPPHLGGLDSGPDGRGCRVLSRHDGDGEGTR
jgi:hypothetical protein